MSKNKQTKREEVNIDSKSNQTVDSTIENNSLQSERVDSKKKNSKPSDKGKKKVENKFQKQIDRLKKNLKSKEDQFLRVFAEYENYRKRTAKERLELYKTANKDLILQLLSIIDDFERASKNKSDSENQNEVIKGFELISKKFYQILESNGLKQIDINIGDVFNGDHHEAIAHIPTDKKSQSGLIIDVTEKGYQLEDVVIRYPKVVVGK
ncbi:MAG: nucleotide exchange factor GrpE [Flavobacteriaceae bacterium]|nr:nucleotide exchange factor GrpE [Flavobacteriaceae bacterium]MCY4217532.1 nucleotide exchange factor GrpE [Flavobacteriaceae bacterium]MCY4254121.1 nucleotide exchange factor GrpE [Flavobacteriaceae bacterium]